MLTLCIAAAAVWFGLRWFERVQLYSPSREMPFHPGTMGLRYSDVTLRAVDGALLHGWHLPGDADGPTLLFLHGNAGNISHRVEKLRLFHGLGLSQFIVDYRGYGKSDGLPTEQGTYRDAEAAYLHLTRERDVPAGRIVVYGESLGSAVAAHLAANRPVGALILDSGFTSVTDMGRLVFPRLPIEWMVRFKYDTRAALAKVLCPVLVLHSVDDEIVPFSMGESLFAAARGFRRFARLRGSHNEGFLESGPSYVEAIGSFLREAPAAAR